MKNVFLFEKKQKRNIPARLIELSKTAKELSRKALKTGTKDDHKRAMDAHDHVGKIAIKMGFDDFGDEHKGLAHDEWMLTRKKRD